MDTQEFHYRIAGRSGGWQPGAHGGRALGTGLHFASHRRLLEHPDPRRIDVRASLRDPRGEWLVRLARQPVVVPVHLVADVSASMHLGAPQRKLDAVADFAEGLGLSAFRVGDPLGLLAFDGVAPQARADLQQLPRRGRGMGTALAAQLRAVPPPPRTAQPHTAAGLQACCEQLGGRDALVFVASDFHGVDEAALVRALTALWPARVVPLLTWHTSEVAPPDEQGWLPLADAESGQRRSLWMRASVRQAWHDAVTARRTQLRAFFRQQGCPLFELIGARGRFEPEALTRYFFESTA